MGGKVYRINEEVEVEEANNKIVKEESNTQRCKRNLLKQSKKASHVLLTPLPFQFYSPSQFFLFPFSTILLFSLLNVFIPSSKILLFSFLILEFPPFPQY